MPRAAKWIVRTPRYRHETEVPRRSPAMRGSTAHYVRCIDPADISRIRPDHRELNGETFRREDRPVVNSRTGGRGHRGMDAHCRCRAEPMPDQPGGHHSAPSAPLSTKPR
jgi:uncharacterized protein with gpF-like domain